MDVGLKSGSSVMRGTPRGSTHRTSFIDYVSEVYNSRASHEKQGGTNLRFFCKIRLNQTERKLWTSNDVTAQELPGGSLVRFLGAS